jgi:hypothetical protein
MTTRLRGTHPSKARAANLIVTWILLPLSAPIVFLYRLVDRTFDLSGRAAKRNLSNLTREVQTKYGFLFSKFGGRILANESSGAPSMDHASLVIEVRSLCLQASRDRGETSWSVCALGSPNSWQQLEIVLNRMRLD